MGDAVTLDRVIELLRQRTDGGGSAVCASDRIADLGVDSIDLMYILSTFERTDDADFADEDFNVGQYATVAELAALIDRRISG